MKRKKIGITIAAMVILGLGFIVYNAMQILSRYAA